MTIWLAAVLGVVPPCIVAAGAAMRGNVMQRLAAFQIAASLVVITLALMSFAFGQPSFIDLALTLGLLSLPGTLLFAFVLERWL